MAVTNSEIGAYAHSLTDVGTPAAGDELIIYDVSASTTKKVLASEFTGAGAITRHSCRAKRTTAQTISTATLTAVAFNATDDWDTDSFHDTVTNNSRLTVGTGLDGLYLLEANIPWQLSGTGSRGAWFKLNNTTVIGALYDGAYSGGIDAHNFAGSLVYPLAATDYVEVVVYQNSGGNRDIVVQDGGPHFTITRLSD